MIRKIICDNAKHHSSPCEERRRTKQWNIGLKQAWTHMSQGGNEEDKGDNDYLDIAMRYFLDLLMWHFREKRTRDICLPQYFWCFSPSSSFTAIKDIIKKTIAIIIIIKVLAGLGTAANLLVMVVILGHRRVRR